MRSGNDDEDEDDDDEHFKCTPSQQGTTCLKPLPVLLLLFAESISVTQRGSANDSRAAAFRHGAVVARKGSLVMNQYVQLLVQTFSPPVQLY